MPNLQRFFARQGAELEITKERDDYRPGDLVAWDLNGKSLWHIGIVVEKPGSPGSRWIVHSIGSGPVLQDCLFDWKIVGHNRYAPKVSARGASVRALRKDSPTAVASRKRANECLFQFPAN